ncbi:MAG: hypothetical protein LBQ62_02705 [Candidatus Accumulibacter sp.]|jgi:hypothetical protein|nr:hypothetical protein [Accumulibacter sp.]
MNATGKNEAKTPAARAEQNPRRSSAPWLPALVLGLSGAVAAGIGVAWHPDLLFAFATEDAPLAWQQGMLLVASASVCGLRAQGAAQKRQGSASWFWGVLALCLLLAALDERFMFHEQMQDYLFYTVADAAPAARPWIHALLALYAGVGLALLFFLRRLASRAAWRWFWPAITSGLAAIALDIRYDTIGMQLYEELLETLSSTLFLCGLFREAAPPSTAAPADDSLPVSASNHPPNGSSR